TAFIGCIAVRSCPDGVVMVARVFRINGDERDTAQIGTSFETRRRRAFGFGKRFARKLRRDAMLMYGDEADRARLAHAAKALDDARTRQARGPPCQRFGHNEFVGSGP